MNTMTVQVLVPSKGQERIQFTIDKEETVFAFRKKVASKIKMSTKSFYLIALGKILVDKCNDKTPAQLFNTYSVRHQTCVFVHVRPQLEKQAVTTVSPTTNNEKIAHISNNSIIEPFGDFVCDVCHNDNTKIKCKECGCQACHKKTGNPLICDQCDGYWHSSCAGLDRYPTCEFWYCPDCENRETELIVGKGKTLATNSKRKYLSYRNLDNDTAVVPSTYIGSIPGVSCGQTWRGRRECNEWGVHRPPVSTIGGSNKHGAVSLILSLKSDHGYDKGYEFEFAGNGGCEKGRKYISEQVLDQTLERFNLSLALTCDAPLNKKQGAVAFNWKKSRPIRVCRAAVGDPRYRTEFTPVKGIRYDGLYKLVKYWPDRQNKHKLIVWKFLFRRDDPECPPWMSYGQRLITERGLRFVSRDPRERKRDDVKPVAFKVPSSARRLIEQDVLDKRMWDDVLKQTFYSKFEFLQYLFDKTFVCTSGACSKPIKDPVTTPCGHICCLNCLNQSGTNCCFVCRTEIVDLKVNALLVDALKALHKNYGKPISQIIPAYQPSVKREQNANFDSNGRFYKKKKTIHVVIERDCKL